MSKTSGIYNMLKSLLKINAITTIDQPFKNFGFIKIYLKGEINVQNISLNVSSFKNRIRESRGYVYENKKERKK